MTKTTLTAIWSWLKKKKNNFNQVILAGFVKNIDDDDKEVRDHCHITEKFGNASHCDCNINLWLKKLL